MNQRFDVCIIGGGAAALAAAASLDRRVSACILEKNQILGRKILEQQDGKGHLEHEGVEVVRKALVHQSDMPQEHAQEHGEKDGKCRIDAEDEAVHKVPFAIPSALWRHQPAATQSEAL